MTTFEIRTQVHLLDSRAFKHYLSSPGTCHRLGALKDGASLHEAELTNPGLCHMHTYPRLDCTGALESFRKQFTSPDSAVPHPVVTLVLGRKAAFQGDREGPLCLIMS